MRSITKAEASCTIERIIKDENGNEIGRETMWTDTKTHSDTTTVGNLLNYAKSFNDKLNHLRLKTKSV